MANNAREFRGKVRGLSEWMHAGKVGSCLVRVEWRSREARAALATGRSSNDLEKSTLLQGG